MSEASNFSYSFLHLYKLTHKKKVSPLNPEKSVKRGAKERTEARNQTKKKNAPKKKKYKIEKVKSEETQDKTQNKTNWRYGREREITTVERLCVPPLCVAFLKVIF